MRGILLSRKYGPYYIGAFNFRGRSCLTDNDEEFERVDLRVNENRYHEEDFIHYKSQREALDNTLEEPDLVYDGVPEVEISCRAPRYAPEALRIVQSRTNEHF